MSDFIKSFEKKNRPQFQKYKKYFIENDWSTPIVTKNDEGRIISAKYYTIKDVRFKGDRETWDGKEPEYRVQQKIAETVLNRLKHFVKNTESEFEPDKRKKAKTAIKQMLSIIDLHTKRIDGYISSNENFDDIVLEDTEEKKTEKDYKSEEIAFDDILYRDQVKIEEEIQKLNLEEEDKTEGIVFLDNAKAPLSMHTVLVREYPEIQDKLDAMKIDFESAPKNEMLIHIENPPLWNPDKHYWEQDKKTLQFYVDEFKKIKRGVKIGGVYFTGWMYCHLNVFKTDVPQPVINKHTGKVEVEDRLMHPPLRDNEWFIIQDSYEKAKEEGNMMFLCATRRAAKTTDIASHLHHKTLSGGKELVVAGGSEKDLGQIEKNFRKTVTNTNPAFAIPNISNDWSKKVRLGLKKKSQKDIIFCELNIVNLESGGEKASEKLAGFTPDAFVLDECMKAPFLDQLNAAKPAFDSGFGKRLVAILSGTGSSNEALTGDALKVLGNPELHEVSQMDWDALERGVPEEYITWQRRKFGTFLPAQMSAKEGMIKIEKTLSEYLGVDPHPKLDQIKIQVTDWKRAIQIIQKDRDEKEPDRKAYIKELVYYPIDPEEIFLSGKPNPFPRDEIQRYKERLVEEGDVGKKVMLELDKEGNVQYEMAEQMHYAPFPFGGGFHNAPVTIYEDPIPNAPFEFYLIGHDGYKQEQSDSDSVGSFVVIRRDNGKVVASYHSRPDPQTALHKQGYLLAKLYGAPVFMENADMDFKSYTDSIGETDRYVLKAIDFLGDMAMDNNGRRQYGWTPTPKNKSYLLGILINMTKKQENYEDEYGKIRTKWGFERCKDIRILDEMISFKPDGNFDAITAYMSATGYDFYLTSNYGAPKPPMTEEEKRIREKQRLEHNKGRKNTGMFPNTNAYKRNWRK